jgi:hypothetical protein
MILAPTPLRAKRRPSVAAGPAFSTHTQWIGRYGTLRPATVYPIRLPIADNVSRALWQPVAQEGFPRPARSGHADEHGLGATVRGGVGEHGERPALFRPKAPLSHRLDRFQGGSIGELRRKGERGAEKRRPREYGLSRPFAAAPTIGDTLDGGALYQV